MVFSFVIALPDSGWNKANRNCSKYREILFLLSSKKCKKILYFSAWDFGNFCLFFNGFSCVHGAHNGRSSGDCRCEAWGESAFRLADQEWRGKRRGCWVQRVNLLRVLALLAPRIDDFNPASFEIPDIAGSNGGTLRVADGGYLAVKFTDWPPCCTATGSNDRIRFSGGAIKGQNTVQKIIPQYFFERLGTGHAAFAIWHDNNAIAQLGFADRSCVDFSWNLGRKPCFNLRIWYRTQDF